MKYFTSGTAIECLSIPIILHKEPGDDKVIWNEGCMSFELECLFIWLISFVNLKSNIIWVEMNDEDLPKNHKYIQKSLLHI